MLLNDSTEPTDEGVPDIPEAVPGPLDVVCFGILTPMRIGTVEEYPPADSGAIILELIDFICADAAVTGLTLDGLGCRVGLISNDVGNDPEGRELRNRFQSTDMATTFTLQDDVTTPFGLTLVDRAGSRTWFNFMSNAVETLSTVDLGLVPQADLLYVDVYPEIWQASVRAIDHAIEHSVPVFVNLDDCYTVDDELDQCLQQGVSVIQRAAGGQSVEQACETAQTLLDSYAASLCALTMGPNGVVYANDSGTFHLAAHEVEVAHTAGAGATFSAGLIFGLVQSWPDDEAVAFANALAGLNCSVPEGVSSFSVTDVMEFALSRGLQLTKLI